MYSNIFKILLKPYVLESFHCIGRRKLYWQITWRNHQLHKNII